MSHVCIRTQPLSGKLQACTLSFFLQVSLSRSLSLLLLERISTQHFMLRRVSCAGAVDIFMSLLGTFHPHKYYSWSRSLFGAAVRHTHSRLPSPSITRSSLGRTHSIANTAELSNCTQHEKFVYSGMEKRRRSRQKKDKHVKKNSKESIR